MQMLSLYKPWTQPTDEYRNHCIGNFPNAKLFRLHSRALNLTFAFGAFGIKYGAVDQSFAPPYFMKVNGMPYWRMLFANNASEPPANPLHMYIYDSDYHIKDNPLPTTVSTTSTSCPCLGRRSTPPLLLRRRTLQLRLRLSNSTRASRRSTSINRVTDAKAACPFRPSL